jgi:ADP-ribose pyrophosphatase YjhB (NUDIX family)
MKFCSQCGHPVTLRVPADDNRPRHVCDACGAVHYVNPKVVAGCTVVSDDGRFLICRRAIEPRHGLWTVPAGFMELGETAAEAAARETREEALAEVADLHLHCVVDVPQVSQVHLMFRGRLVGMGFGAGAETLEARLVPASDIPWDEIAFPSVRASLERYLADRERGRFEVHAFAVGRLGA